MSAGLSTIQQTLTPEAASVLNHSIAEAGRRNHGQTTPLHVTATLLASPSGFLRQACIRSHPNSSHPLQCRALELCFSVALEQLPTAQSMAPGMEPPISNALMAALKRAQAHQRRGCPEQQQQPLLAVKVELEQLIISILDDPSVSRVMGEASFSSPAVKATIEQSLSSNSSSSSNPISNPIPHGNVRLGTFGGISGPRMLTVPSSIPAAATTTPTLAPVVIMPNRNMYLNRRLVECPPGQSASQRNDEVKKVVDILMKSKKRNPVLVGEAEPEVLVKELLKRIEKGELGSDGVLKDVKVISIEKELGSDRNQIVEKIKELGGLVESMIKGEGNGGVILDLGDLKWLVEQPATLGSSGGVQPPQQVVSEAARAAVVEMGKALARFGETNNVRKIWLIGTATFETYLRCQVYHPTMENDWDLQAVRIASKSPVPGMLSRLGTERILGNPVEPLSSLKSFPTVNPALTRGAPENLDPSRKNSCCPQCLEKYEQELKLVKEELENSSLESKSEPAKPSSLPPWLQNAKLSKGDTKTSDLSQKDQELLVKQKTRDLQRKWNDTCLRLHPNFHQNVSSEKINSPAPPTMGLYNPNLLLRQPLQSKLPSTRMFGNTLQLNAKETTAQPLDRVCTPNPSIIQPLDRGITPSQAAVQPSDRAGAPPGSPVRTELVLGRKVTETTAPEKPREIGENVKDLLSCLSSAPQIKLLDIFASALDADSFKKLLKGLMGKAWWQPEAASTVASAVTRCRLGNGKRRGAASKGDIWFLFTGPDRIAKRKMACVISDQICGVSPIMISLGSRRDDGERDTIFRGKTVLDRIVEAVRMNPFSVIVLEDIDETDVLMRVNIKRAMERGRLTDSHGREISLGNVIFIVTGNWSSVSNGNSADEKKFASIASGNWQLKLTMSEKNAKRRANWLLDDDRLARPRKDGSGLSFDLNQAADGEDDRTDGSHNSSSELTVDHEDEHGLEARQFSITSVPNELVNLADDAIVFKPVDLGFVRREIRKTIATKFSIVVDNRVSIEVEEEAVERIVGGLWHGRSSLEEWVENALTPSFEQLNGRLPSTAGNAVVHLQLDLNSAASDSRGNGELLPGKLAVMVDGALT